MTDELHNGYKYNGEDDRPRELPTVEDFLDAGWQPVTCVEPRHYYDVIDDVIAETCRCGGHKRKLMR